MRTMGITELTQPAIEPVTLAEVKSYLKIEWSEENTLLSSLITAARQHVETRQRRALIQRTFRLTLDHFPCGNGPIRPPRSPLVSVEAITYLDENGDEQQFEDFYVDAATVPGRIVPVIDVDWPSTNWDQINSVTVDFTAGYGEQAADVPMATRQAIIWLVGHWYEQREPVVVGSTPMVVPLHVESLIFQNTVLEVD